MSTIKPYLAIILSLILTIALIGDIFFLNVLPELGLLVLWLSLAITILLSIFQMNRTEKDAKNLSEQLAITKERLGNEIKHRLWAEKTASEIKIKSQIIDENIPVMLAYFNPDLRCRYHNRIFRRWFGLTPDQIDGKLLKEFATEEFYSTIQNNVTEILAGKTIHNERILKSTKGFPYIFTEQYIPHLDTRGKSIGFYTLHTPRAQEKNRIPLKSRTDATAKPVSDNKPQEPSAKIITDSQQQTLVSKSGITAARIAEAIDKEEFKLYCQKIAPIKASDAATIHYEILIRMNEEENNLMPPGSFLPLVEQFKMMPKLDRWIINHIIEWLSRHSDQNIVFNINVAGDTLKDHSLPDFIQTQLQKMKVTATALCFEIELTDAEADLENASIFIQKIRELGCLVSLCSFSGSPESICLLEKMKVDFIKIDGSIICNILRDEDDLAQLVAIHRLTQQAHLKTVAELVETDDIAAKLREIGIDFGQGFNIDRPQPFEHLQSMI